MHAVIDQLPYSYQAMQTRLWYHNIFQSYFVKEIENGHPVFIYT